jgi:hypothetical protein
MKKSGSRVAKDVEALGKVLSVLTDVDERQRGWIIAAAVRKLGIAAPTIHSTPVAGAVNKLSWGCRRKAGIKRACEGARKEFYPLEECTNGRASSRSIGVLPHPFQEQMVIQAAGFDSPEQ